MWSSRNDTLSFSVLCAQNSNSSKILKEHRIIKRRIKNGQERTESNFRPYNPWSVKQIVENEGLDFKYGRAYYQFKTHKNKKGMVKGEVISLSKKIIAIDKETKNVFLDEEARAIIRTPNTVETAKQPYIPTDNIRENYLIFIQSKSWKRVPKRCFLIYLIYNRN